MQWEHAVEFRLLGPVAVYLRGQARPLGGPRQRAVLVALLLHANDEVRTNQLLELVWSDVPSSAESNLRTYLTRLRRILRVPGEQESRLQTRRGGHLVTVRPGELDVATFTDLATKGEQAGDNSVACQYFERALNTWRGRALENVALGPLLEAEATQLEVQREHIREQYLRARLALGQHAELLPELRALLLRNPLWERLAGMLMVALYRSGQRTEALNVFRQTRTRLVEELGVEPGTELRDLHQRLLAGDDPGDSGVLSVLSGSLPTPRPARTEVSTTEAAAKPPDRPARMTGTTSPHGIRLRHPARPPVPAVPGHGPVAERPAQLPVDLPTFTGRKAELADLVELPASSEELPDNRAIITIDGMAGIGKTTLAVHAAHWLAPHYPDGQLFLDLHGHTRGVDPLDPNEALDRMLRALGVSANEFPPSTEARASMYRSLLASRKMLIVLDNAHSEAQVRPLLPGAGGSRTLITSRRRLTGLPHAHPLSVDVLPSAEAIALFTRISTPRRLASEPSELIEEIAELCGRLPLAIRIAAVRLRDRPFWTLAHLRDRLADQQQRLTELHSGENGVAAAFNLSVADLEPDKQRALTMLGLNPGTNIELNAAAALAGMSVPTADRLLEELVDAHLLRQTAPGRYELHNLMRAFMMERASAGDPQEIRHAIRRLLDYYLHTADATDQLIQPVRPRAELQPPDPVVVPLRFADINQALSWCDQTHPDFLHLVRAAEKHDLLTHAWQLPMRMESYIDIRNHWVEGTAAYEIALRAARRLEDRSAENELLMGLAFGWAQLQSYQKAIGYYTAAIEVCQEIGNNYAEGFSAMGLAEVYRRLHRFADAVLYHKRALEAYRRTGDTYAVCVSLDCLGNTYRDLGRVDEAVECYRQAYLDSERIGNTFGAGRYLLNLGRTHQMLGRYDESSATAEQALARCVQAGDRHGEAYALTMLAQAEAVLGEPGPARAKFVTAQRILHELGDDREAEVRTYLAGLDDDVTVLSQVDITEPR
ncbi:MAG: BTAD domain-containing putative transcriptional regulator [Kibdelosporangium sp.]